MSLLLLSFIAGIVTILAPCVFPLLPIIIGGSTTNASKWRPFIITFSLAVSLLLFTVVLKSLSIFANIDPAILSVVSGVIIIVLGLITVFPNQWDAVNIKLGFSKNSDELLHKAQSNKSGVLNAILTGAALGPVFSSCSPTYVFVLSTVIKGTDLVDSYLNLFAYILGLSLVMLAVSLGGRAVISRLKFASNPNGSFKKIIGVLFILVGILFVTGQDKNFQRYISERLPFSSSQFEQKLLEQNKLVSASSTELVDATIAKVAPSLVGVNSWINSDGVTLESLRGKVVLVDFWTYSCINCQRTFPYLNAWQNKYKDSGFTVLGLHAPEFTFEKKIENVRKATEQFGITYPVGLDNEFKTWDAFNNKTWPAKYLIDTNGKIRYQHFGEGDYNETEDAIQALIKENGGSVTDKTNVNANMGLAVEGQNPETYLGWARGEFFANKQQLAGNENKLVSYTALPISGNKWTLSGDWTINNENIISGKGAKLSITISAKDVYLVAGAGTPSLVKVLLGDKPMDNLVAGKSVKDGNMLVDGDQLYHIVSFKEFTKDQILTLQVPAGVRFNAFSFGGI